MKDVDGDDWGDDNPPVGVTAGTDCSDTNGNVWALPGETPDLLFDSDKQTLSWSEPLDRGGAPGTLEYGLLRSDLARDFTLAVACIAAGGSTSTTDSATPPAGTAFFYLVRASNECGQGTLGTGSDGTDRVGATCP